MLAKVDVDANQELALRYQVQGIPAVKAFRNGHVVDEFVGAQAPVAVARFLAFELLLEAIQAVEGERREWLLRLTVELFADLGHDHPLTMRYRRQLAATIY